MFVTRFRTYRLVNLIRRISWYIPWCNIHFSLNLYNAINRPLWLLITHLKVNNIGWIQTLFLWILKLRFRNFDFIIRFAMKNRSDNEKFRSRDQRIFEKKWFYEVETLRHNHVNTVSYKRNWTSSSDSVSGLVPVTEVWFCRDYVIWCNYEKSIFWTWAILGSLIRQVSSYAHISNWNFNADIVHIKLFGSAYANFFKRVFLLRLPTH